MDLSTHKSEKIMDIQYFNTSFEIRDTYLFCSYYLQLFTGGIFTPPDQKVINAVLRTQSGLFLVALSTDLLLLNSRFKVLSSLHLQIHAFTDISTSGSK